MAFRPKKQPFWGNRQTIFCWPLQMNTAKGKGNFIWHHATSRCANETTWKRGKNHMFQERTNTNQWIYEQDVDVISHVPAHTKCTWKPYLRSDNPPVRMFIPRFFRAFSPSWEYWLGMVAKSCTTKRMVETCWNLTYEYIYIYNYINSGINHQLVQDFATIHRMIVEMCWNAPMVLDV